MGIYKESLVKYQWYNLDGGLKSTHGNIVSIWLYFIMKFGRLKEYVMSPRSWE